MPKKCHLLTKYVFTLQQFHYRDTGIKKENQQMAYKYVWYEKYFLLKFVWQQECSKYFLKSLSNKW